MKPLKLLFAISLVLTLCAFGSCGKDDDKSEADAKKAAQQKAAHDAFVGDAPKAEPAYNIMDYAKSPSPNNAGGQKANPPNSNPAQKP